MESNTSHTIRGPASGLRGELSLVQTVALPAGVATATGAKVYVDNAVLLCE